MQRMAIHTMKQGLTPYSTEYNTVTAYELADTDTQTFDANTIHSISFSVIQGTLDVSFDGGSTTVSYVAGQSLTIEATTTFAQDIILTMSAGVGDNATVQVTSE